MPAERTTRPLDLTIVSGGQTGVDRAALDAAQEFRLASGGWCPQGRRAEDGPIPLAYPLQETPSGDYWQRTEWNVRDSDGTLVLTRGQPTQGTAYTIEAATRLRRPCLVLDLDTHPSAQPVQAWLSEEGIVRLNVAGPRETKCPGIYREAREFLQCALSALTARPIQPDTR